MLRNFRVDLLSFVVGFLSATLLWWLVSRLKPLLPGLIAQIRKYIQTTRRRNLEGADGYIRQDVLRRAEKLHLTSHMFPLDEVIIQPRLLAPPAPVDPDQGEKHETVVAQIFPYLPDWPELAAGHYAATITLGEALQNGANIAVIAQPGCGKTVALASLAAQFARKDPALRNLSQHLALFHHALDLNPELPEGGDPFPALLSLVTARVAVVFQPQVKRLLLDRIAQKQLVFILDGLDELHPDALKKSSLYLKALKEKYPGIQVVVAASPYHLDGLVDQSFVPLGLAMWSSVEREAFLSRWSQAWAAHIAPAVAKQQNLTIVSPLLLDNWLKGERGFVSPVEWTLRIWGAYTGDLQPAPLAAFTTLFSRFASGVTTASALETLAQEFIVKGQAALPYPALETLLTRLAPENPVFIEPPIETAEPAPHKPIPPKGAKAKGEKRDMILSVGEQILENLVKGGILIEHQGSMVRFANPVFAGYLAGRNPSVELITAATRNPFWVYAEQALRFTAAVSNDNGWIENYLQSENSPLARPLLVAARWLTHGKPGSSWRGGIFRRLLSGIQNESLPLGLRARMLAAFVVSNDPSVPKLFKQLSTALNPSVRMLAVLGIGAWGDPALVHDITNLLEDPDENVRVACCLGLVSLHTDSAMSAVSALMLNGDEKLRQAAAESLIHIPLRGAEIIREAVQVNDILTRRAAVFGLLQVREPWSKQLLEKTAIEDGQWVVRNAAAHALEVLQSPDARIPTPLIPPHDSPWLTGFAGKRNLGLSPYQPATDILLTALKTGTVEDQQAALRYLQTGPEDKVIQAVYTILYGDHPIALREAALYVVWTWMLAGVNLPSPTSLGITMI